MPAWNSLVGVCANSCLVFYLFIWVRCVQGTDWSGTIKVGNFAQWGLSYIQSVSKNLALGVDITYLGKPPFNQV
jgi:hypothetical protein